MMLKFTRFSMAVATAGALGLLAIGSAQAAVETVSGTYGPAVTDWTSATVGTISIPKFNSALGTLTEVQIGVNSTVTGSLNVLTSNFVVGAGNSVNIESQMGVIDPFTGAGCGNTLSACPLLTGAVGVLVTIGTGTYTSNINNPSVSMTAASGDAYSVANYGLTPFYATATSTSSFNGPTGAAYLSDFTGTGNITYAIATTTALNGTFSSGAYTISAATSASAALSVIYTYSSATSAPEPASIAILGVGLAALGAKRRRKA